MPVLVTIQEADVYYQPQNGTTSASHDFFKAAKVQTAAAGAGLVTPIPVTLVKLSTKRNVDGIAPHWISLSESDFVRFKNGGKRLPDTDGKYLRAAVIGKIKRDRPNREHSDVKEGDVGPYKRGEGNLYKGSLVPPDSIKPPGWVPGTSGTPDFFETDPAPHVQMQQARDHQNNQKALKERGENPADGPAIVVPQWIHMNGYTFGAKANRQKNKNPDWGGQTRSEWIANHPFEALFKEMYQSLRLYDESSQLKYETVGSFRYLYKLNFERWKGFLNPASPQQPYDSLDRLIMHYLNIAK